VPDARDASPEYEHSDQEEERDQRGHVFFLFPDRTPRRLCEDGLDADHAPAGIALVAGKARVGLLDAWASSLASVYTARQLLMTATTGLWPGIYSRRWRGEQIGRVDAKRPYDPADIPDRPRSASAFHQLPKPRNPNKRGPQAGGPHLSSTRRA
jgi:hypothetical protein